MSEPTLQVLAIGDDGMLPDEVAAALGERRAALRHAADFRSAADAVRRREPDLVVSELGGDAKALRDFASLLRALAPGAIVLGLRPAGAVDLDDAVLVEALRARFDDVLRRPLSSAELRPWLDRAARSGRDARRRDAVLVAFHSTKGGVGKSTLSVNVACLLGERHPDRVLLVDASVQLGTCAAALDLEPAATLADAARERERLDATLLRELSVPHASGLRLLAAPRDPIDASEIDEEALARVLGTARRSFAFVVVDTLPIVDGLSLTVLEQADRVYLVNQGTVPDVIGAARLLALLDGIGVGAERRRIVLNRNVPRFAGALGAGQVGERLGAPIDHEIPFERRVFTGLNLGEPFALRARRRFRWGAAIARIAANVEQLAAERSGP